MDLMATVRFGTQADLGGKTGPSVTWRAFHTKTEICCRRSAPWTLFIKSAIAMMPPYARVPLQAIDTLFQRAIGSLQQSLLNFERLSAIGSLHVPPELFLEQVSEDCQNLLAKEVLSSQFRRALNYFDNSKGKSGSIIESSKYSRESSMQGDWCE
jgi:hypothetical protein